MKVAIAVKKGNEVVTPKRLIPVIVKRCRVVDTHENKGAMLNFHTYKCWGGVLNPAAVHGQGCYVRRLIGQDVGRVQRQLEDIVAQRMEAV